MAKIQTIGRVALPIYWAMLTYILLKPVSPPKDYWFAFEGIDKVVHFSAFVVLGFLFRVVFSRISFLHFFLWIFLYALFTEVCQYLMALGRSMELLDLVADMLGVPLGFFLYRIFVKIISK